MSLSYDSFCPRFASGAPNYFDAPYKDIHLYVPVADIITIDASTESNLPGIAADRLNSRYLYWVLLLFNGLHDPIQDIRPGVKLKIPNYELLISYLKSRTAAQSGTNYLTPSTVTVI